MKWILLLLFSTHALALDVKVTKLITVTGTIDEIRALPQVGHKHFGRTDCAVIDGENTCTIYVPVIRDKWDWLHLCYQGHELSHVIGWLTGNINWHDKAPHSGCD